MHLIATAVCAGSAVHTLQHTTPKGYVEYRAPRTAELKLLAANTNSVPAAARVSCRRPVNLLDVEIREAPVSEGLCCIQLSSVRKTHIIRCPTEGECTFLRRVCASLPPAACLELIEAVEVLSTDVRTQWLRALRASKRHAIEVGLGHANESATDFAARSVRAAVCVGRTCGGSSPDLEPMPADHVRHGVHDTAGKQDHS